MIRPRQDHEAGPVLARAPLEHLAALAAQAGVEVVEGAERVQLDIGGIEYLIDDRDGKPYFYDINALSNFVADAPNVIGFDPFARFVDYLELRAGIVARRIAA